MFRRVDLPSRIPGRLLLHSMPGRFEAIEKVWQQLGSESVGAIVCLNELYEIRMKSSEYAEALETGTVPCSVLPFEIRERGAPSKASRRDRGGETAVLVIVIHFVETAKEGRALNHTIIARS